MQNTSSITVAILGFLAFGTQSFAEPKITEPGFSATIFAQFDMKPLRCFGLAINDGKQGYPAGLYVTTGPLPDRDRVLFVDPTGKVSVFATGFVSTEGILFGRGAYGPWLYVAAIKEGVVYRIAPDGKKTVFAAESFTQGNAKDTNFGPAQLAWGPDGFMYATDYSGGMLVRITPDGKTNVVTNNLRDLNSVDHKTLPLSSSPRSEEVKGGPGVKPLAFPDSLSVLENKFHGLGLVGFYNRNSAPYEGRLLAVGLPPFVTDGKVEFKVDKMEGLQLASSGPGGDFGDSYFVGSEGVEQPDEMDDGAVFRIDEDWVPKPFITGIDATHAIFDTQKVLGGGMFVCDMNQELWDAKQNTIWRIQRD